MECVTHMTHDACEGSAVLGSDAAAVLVTKGWIMGGGAMQV